MQWKNAGVTHSSVGRHFPIKCLETKWWPLSKACWILLKWVTRDISPVLVACPILEAQLITWIPTNEEPLCRNAVVLQAICTCYHGFSSFVSAYAMLTFSFKTKIVYDHQVQQCTTRWHSHKLVRFNSTKKMCRLMPHKISYLFWIFRIYLRPYKYSNHNSILSLTLSYLLLFWKLETYSLLNYTNVRENVN